VRISNQARDTLGCARATQHACPFFPPSLTLCVRSQLLEPLVQDPLNRSLRYAKVAGRQALVEALDAFRSHNLLDAGPASPGCTRALTALDELQPCLHNPDRICSCAGDESREGGCTKVHKAVFFAVVEGVGDDLLAIAVGEEVD
jgi:hypothetical protein